MHLWLGLVENEERWTTVEFATGVETGLPWWDKSVGHRMTYSVGAPENHNNYHHHESDCPRLTPGYPLTCDLTYL